MVLRNIFACSFLWALIAVIVNTQTTIQKLHIRSDILYRFNKVTVTSRIKNEGSGREKLVFQFAVPNDAFISRLSLRMSHIHVEGRVVEQLSNALAKKAQESHQYGLRPRGTSHFRISIVAPRDAIAEITLTYEQMLTRRGGEYRHVLYLHPGSLVENLRVTVNIHESRDLVNLRVPPLRGELIEIHDEMVENKLVKITRNGSRTAKIVYKPTMEEQQLETVNGLEGLFTVKYDIQRGMDTGDMLVHNGYFFHYFAPSGLTVIPRDIVFVLDDSGSMAGRKIEQMKESMYNILKILHPKDRFHFIQFSDIIKPRAEGFTDVTPESIESAKNYVRDTFVARGKTNIYESIIAGLKSFRSIPHRYEARSKIMVFLTDGQATVGETNPQKMLSMFNKINKDEVIIFCIAFGADADFTLMRRISLENSGIATRIYEARDSAMQLYGFFKEFSRLLMVGIKFDYNSDYLIDNSIRRSSYANYYDGTEVVNVGKLYYGYNTNVDIRARELKDGHLTNAQHLRSGSYTFDTPPFMTEEEYTITIERMWAYYMVRYLMRIMYMSRYRDNFKENYARLRELSLKYNYLNAITTMQLENSDGSVMTGGFGDIEHGYSRDMYGEAASGGFNEIVAGLRRRSSGLVYDPHFIIELPELEFPLCFEVLASSGDNLLLLHDPQSDLRVTATVVESQVQNKDGHFRTYLGAVLITIDKYRVYVTPQRIDLNGLKLSWHQEKTIKMNHMQIVITGSGKHLSLIVNNSTRLMVQRYMLAQRNNHKRINYINFYITDYIGLSNRTDGLLGQFSHTNIYAKKSKNQYHMKPKDTELICNDGTGKDFIVEATLIERMDLLNPHTTVPCWRIPTAEDSALFGGKPMEEYFLPSL